MFWFKNLSLFSIIVRKWNVIIYLLLEINTNWAFTYWFWSWTRYNWQSIVIDRISRGVQLSIVRFPPRSPPRSATLGATIDIDGRRAARDVPYGTFPFLFSVLYAALIAVILLKLIISTASSSYLASGHMTNLFSIPWRQLLSPSADDALRYVAISTASGDNVI